MWIEEGGKLGIYDVKTFSRFKNRVDWNYDGKSFFASTEFYDCKFNEKKKGNLPCKVNFHISKPSNQGVPYIGERLKSCSKLELTH
ncbi:MAG: hypothetical protein FWK04_32975 [Nostoc sp. GBBB01]|nr:hypothetical protein [Nostoc sp. GBBB01]